MGGVKDPRVLLAQTLLDEAKVSADPTKVDLAEAGLEQAMAAKQKSYDAKMKGGTWRWRVQLGAGIRFSSLVEA
jgi:hypothetical protein